MTAVHQLQPQSTVPFTLNDPQIEPISIKAKPSIECNNPESSSHQVNSNSFISISSSPSKQQFDFRQSLICNNNNTYNQTSAINSSGYNNYINTNSSKSNQSIVAANNSNSGGQVPTDKSAYQTIDISQYKVSASSLSGTFGSAQKKSGDLEAAKKAQHECKNCAIIKQEIEFYQLSMKESEEREANLKQLNDTLFAAVSSADSSAKPAAAKDQKLSDELREQVDVLIAQMEARRQQYETSSRQLLKRFDEVTAEKQSLSEQVLHLNASEISMKDKLSRFELAELSLHSTINELNSKLALSTEHFKKEQAIGLQLRTQMSQLESSMNSKLANASLNIEQLSSEVEQSNATLKRVQEEHAVEIDVFKKRISVFERMNGEAFGQQEELKDDLQRQISVLRESAKTDAGTIVSLRTALNNAKAQLVVLAELKRQLEEQERTIEQLQGQSRKSDQMEIQIAQLSTNVTWLEKKVVEKERECNDLKSKRVADKKRHSQAISEMQLKLDTANEIQEKKGKDYARKSAIIVREILNKDIQVKELQAKNRSFYSSGGAGGAGINSIGVTDHTMMTEQLPSHSLSRRIASEENRLAQNHQFVEFNKSQLLSSAAGYSSVNLLENRSRSPFSTSSQQQQIQQTTMIMKDSLYFSKEGAAQVSGFQMFPESSQFFEEEFIGSARETYSLKLQVKFLVDYLVRVFTEQGSSIQDQQVKQSSPLTQNVRMQMMQLVKKAKEQSMQDIIHLIQEKLEPPLISASPEHPSTSRLLTLPIQQQQQQQQQQQPIKSSLTPPSSIDQMEASVRSDVSPLRKATTTLSRYHFSKASQSKTPRTQQQERSSNNSSRISKTTTNQAPIPNKSIYSTVSSNCNSNSNLNKDIASNYQVSQVSLKSTQNTNIAHTTSTSTIVSVNISPRSIPFRQSQEERKRTPSKRQQILSTHTISTTPNTTTSKISQKTNSVVTTQQKFQSFFANKSQQQYPQSAQFNPEAYSSITTTTSEQR